MSRTPDQFPEVLGPIWFAALFIFGGLVMAAYPLKFFSLADDLARAIRQFARHLRAGWQMPFWDPAPTSPSRVAVTLVRIAGIALMAFGFFALRELAH